tara:strand:- start:1713 stop:1937 length:225 start_codon:yes stop_codon:yes gene_type:complete
MKKNFKTKMIDIDLQYQMLDKLTLEGDKPLPSTMLWVVKNCFEITDEEISEIGALAIADLATKVLNDISQGKKK